MTMIHALTFIEKKDNKKGFTLVELLVVISLIGILTLVTVSSFVNAQKKGRDAQRKEELSSVSRALMMYYNDYGRFPATLDLSSTNLNVGLTGTDGFIYMKQLPKERSLTNKPFIYEVSAQGKSYNIFIDLENKEDNSCQHDTNNVGIYSRGGIDYCYGIASPNTTVGTTTRDN